ncbi:MAG: hypothetical protein PHR52_11545 [Fermentimonas sp.]|nr:hypothetical protein [Dysgonamonadaceae bacterium]MDD4698156.1 hypothetical protein [Fermentimonas sp.]
MFNINGIRTVNVRIHQDDLQALTSHWKHFVDSIPPYPKYFEGKGIVICAGGKSYFTCCWILVNILRNEMKSKLPIQVWYMGNEMDNFHIKILSDLNVVCRNFLEYNVGQEIKGFAMKPMAILLSDFKEVIYLDADNTSIIDPDILFDLPEYKRHGAMFWPDFWTTDSSNPIWGIIETPANDSKEQESGQILINKEICWKELNLALYFNLNKSVYYRLLHGDKDTFRFAWLALKKEFHFIEYDVASVGFFDDNKSFIGHTMIQYLPSGQPAFLHRNLIKWDISDCNICIWNKIKAFTPQSQNKRYFTYWDELRGHPIMNLEGDFELSDFNSQVKLENIEAKCLSYLKYLRVNFTL